MKTLLLLRHAKSSWGDESLSDHDRPLNKRGKADAPRMGRMLAEKDIVPDLIVSSTAKRAASTAEVVAKASGYAGEVLYSRDLYLADPETYLEVLAEVDDRYQTVMLVGHNPGLEELVSELSGHEERMPTAALAIFRLHDLSWRDFDASTPVESYEIERPKELS